MNNYEFVEIVEIEELEEIEDTYDITVEDTHNFFANGLLVHNCLGGVYAGCYWEHREEGEEAVLEAMRILTKRFISVLGDRWYGELQWNAVPEQHDLNRYVIQMHKEFNIPLISTADSHYPNPTAWKDRELYKRLGWLGKGRPSWADDGELPTDVDEIGYELYPKNGNQMWEDYLRYSEKAGVSYDDDVVRQSLLNTYTIAHERIENFFPDNTVRLPDFVIPVGETADSALRKFCFEGLRAKNLHNNKEYTDRLEHELGVISDRGFSKYFLTMNEIDNITKEIMLAGPGRGSAAGSLVAYSLDITQVNPIKYGLQFERFLRKDATDYPDIDYDVSDPMILKDRLIEKWGSDVVAPISNWNTLQLKSLIKDISKLYGIPFTEVNSVTGKMMVEATREAKKAHGIKAGVYTPTFEEVKQYSASLQAFLQKYPDVATHVDALYGQVRSCFTDRVSILTDDGYKNIKDIETGDKIAYYGEDNSIHFNDKYEIYFQGNKDVYEVELEDGTTIELTEDHKVLTQDGYKQVKELTENDMLFSVA